MKNKQKAWEQYVQNVWDVNDNTPLPSGSCPQTQCVCSTCPSSASSIVEGTQRRACPGFFQWRHATRSEYESLYLQDKHFGYWFPSCIGCYPPISHKKSRSDHERRCKYCNQSAKLAKLENLCNWCVDQWDHAVPQSPWLVNTTENETKCFCLQNVIEHFDAQTKLMPRRGTWEENAECCRGSWRWKIDEYEQCKDGPWNSPTIRQPWSVPDPSCQCDCIRAECMGACVQKHSSEIGTCLRLLWEKCFEDNGSYLDNITIIEYCKLEQAVGCVGKCKTEHKNCKSRCGFFHQPEEGNRYNPFRYFS